MSTPLNRQIGIRLKARREARGVTQDELAGLMGLNHRQSLGAIESGERHTQPTELVAAARALDVPLDYFTDPYAAAGEAAFSFRAEGAQEVDLDAFEELAGGWVATYRELAKPSLIKHALSLTYRSSYELAQRAGEQTRRDLGLGRFPGFDLEMAIERVWGILVLNADLPNGVSGAASRLEGVQAILISRSESKGRRIYDLAHELFHLLTWDTMPPARLERSISSGGNEGRVEQLANNFAAALLMPTDTLRALWTESASAPLTDRIIAMATAFGVSGPALKWRLLNLDLITRAELPDDNEIACSSAGTRGAESPPSPFNVNFVHRIHQAIEDGALSLRKAARILGLDAAGLSELCKSYGRALPYEV